MADKQEGRMSHDDAFREAAQVREDAEYRKTKSEPRKDESHKEKVSREAGLYQDASDGLDLLRVANEKAYDLIVLKASLDLELTSLLGKESHRRLMKDLKMESDSLLEAVKSSRPNEFSTFIKEVSVNELAILSLKSQEKYLLDDKFTPEVWGKLLAFFIASRRTNNLLLDLKEKNLKVESHRT